MKIVYRKDFAKLFSALNDGGYRIIGPTVSDGAIVYGPVSSVEELPVGITDRQEAGRYRLEKRNDAALFGYVVGPTSWKKFLFPPREKLWQAKKEKTGFKIKPNKPAAEKVAFLGAAIVMGMVECPSNFRVA